MNPLPNEWAIKHRADTCAVTQRPFEPGEYFYTLLYHSAEGYRREDLSEEAWQNRNENIRPFSFWKSRYEPLPEKPAEPLPKENAEQLFRRLWRRIHLRQTPVTSWRPCSKENAF